MSTKKDDQPLPVDRHVGDRVKLRRRLARLSQEALGARVNLTAQQIQKYERGENRIGASRLYDLSQALDVPPSFFFDDMPVDVVSNAPQPIVEAPQEDTEELDPMRNPETSELVGHFQSIADAKTRRKFLELVRTLGDWQLESKDTDD